jgi:hypothetical protein
MQHLRPGRARRDRGNALILVIITLAILTPLVLIMTQLGVARSQVETHSNATLLRTYGAEAGLERARFMVKRHTDRVTNEHWLRDQATSGPDTMTAVTWEDGSSSFTHSAGIRGSAVVRVFVINLTPALDAFSSWYFVVARAESADPSGTIRSLSLAQTMRTTSSFAKYARFVSQQDLSIGAGAHYYGDVHSNADISAANNTVVFHENVSASGDITGGPTALKDLTEGVAEITMPSEEQLSELATTAPGGAVVFDTDDPTFRSTFQAETGYLPSAGDDTEVHVTWKGVVMDIDVKVRNGGGWATWSRTDEPIPHNGTFFVNGDVYTKGNFASRLTVASTNKIYLTDPIRYTNAAGVGQYTLYENGVASAFDTTNNEWTNSADWRGSQFDYRKTDGWAAPTVSGVSYNPSLGLVALNNIDIPSANINGSNAEYHAAFFSSEGTVNSSGSGKKNLYMFGAMITTGTMGMSGTWSYRNYVYDESFMDNPPPAFPTVDEPVFKNWHEVGTIDNGGGTYRVTRSNVKTAFGL